MSDWTTVIMAVHKVTGEAKVIFREREVWSQYPDIFPGYAPTMAVKNYLSGYRMVFEFQGKLYFAGMGNPTATLVEIDPATNEANIVYYNINRTRGEMCIRDSHHRALAAGLRRGFVRPENYPGAVAFSPGRAAVSQSGGAPG